MMDWDVKYSGTSIRDKVKSCRLSKRRDSFCWEIDIELIDQTIYGEIDWTRIPSSPQIELLIDGGSGLASQGRFYIERPTYDVTVEERGLKGIWGRSSVAVLSEPFAKTITKTWKRATTLYAIIDEVLGDSGVTLLRSSTTIPNFAIDPLAYSADKQLPIDIISDLAELCGGIVLSDSSGNIFLQPVNYNPTANDLTLADIDIKGYAEELVFPDFANRVRIIADESAAGADIDLSVSSECLQTGGGTPALAYARVSDDEGRGINGIPVNWATDRGLVSFQDGAVTNTHSMTFFNERQTSKGFYSVEVAFPPTRIVSVYWAKDKAQERNLAEYAHTIDGKTITFNSRLAFCDETLLITYVSKGIASNTLITGPSYGSDVIKASVAGAIAQQEVHIGNPCACSSENDNGDSDLDPKVGVKIVALPTKICAAIKTGQLTNPLFCPCPSPGCGAAILVTAEDNGPISDGRAVKMKETTSPSKLGELKWFSKPLGLVKAEEIPGTVLDEVNGIMRATTGHYWVDGLIQVEYKDPDSATSTWKTVPNVMIQGKAIKWVQSHFSPYKPEAEIRVTGSLWGGAINNYIGLKTGTATIQAAVQFLKEEPVKETVDIEIEGNSNPGSGDSTQENPDYPAKKQDPKDPASPNTKKDHTWVNKTLVQCFDDKGVATKCLPGYVCCQKDGKYGCNKAADCQGTEADTGCEAGDCQGNPTSDCLGGRFSNNSQSSLKGCGCQKMCEKEMNRYGTTQDYDNSSYRKLTNIVTQDFGFDPETDAPLYQEKFGQLQSDAMDQCRKKCGECGANDALTLSGSDVMAAPGGYQFSAGGGNAPYAFAASGTGVSMDQSGMLTLQANACGTIDITVTDKCGATKTMKSRVSTSGQWVMVSHWYPCELLKNDSNMEICIKGGLMYNGAWQVIGWYPEECQSGNRSRVCSSEPLDESRNMTSIKIFEWRCNE